ncbi:zinc finger protein BRUTUS-like At1g74770 isoform X1 [Primulina tabacum]|uniref:zinc finger protein BRUTUS-like At1g74770 isoform X1 n=1 Tax=Primulina tabacum TaxID=48773 RepID=UPI003F59927D
MDGGEREKEEDWVGLPSALQGIKLVDAPVLFFVVSHKAFRSELSSLRRGVKEAAENGGCNREIVFDLSRRLEFLKLVYNYHCAAEDEVIFLALDQHVKNVMPTYSLEHKSIDDGFRSNFHLLDSFLKKDEGTSQMFQELLFSLGTVQAMICHHMEKEEQQVFPLLMQNFTSEEQAQLIWQYMCSVPVILLEEFLPWMTFHLSSDEKLEVLDCIKVVISREILLQEVVVSWLQHDERSSSDPGNICGKGYQFLNELYTSKDILELYPHHILQHDKVCSIEASGAEVPINSISHWHAAMRRDFNQIIEELRLIRSSDSFSTLPLVIVHLKFSADVLIYYSNSLDKIFYPLFSELAKSNLPPCSRLVEESQIECLRRLLFFELQSSEQPESFIEMLSKELESLVEGLNKNLFVLESKVFAFLSKNCSREMQLWLLYTSLRMMPLGLLKSTVSWYSAHFSENQSNLIMENMVLECPLIDKSFISLLYEWVRIGSSGKTSVAKFRQTLQEMLNGRSYYLVEQIRQSSEFSEKFPDPSWDIKEKKSEVNPSSSSSVATAMHDASNYCAMNSHILFPRIFERVHQVQTRPAESGHTFLLSLESRPMDHIFLIHRAFIKDLEYLVSLSSNLATDFGFFADFERRFNLLYNMYQVHSISEDEIAFPALELKEALQNISHSYSIDHKLEVKQFMKTSMILNEISDLHDVASNETGLLQCQQLCLQLHDSCLSLQKVISDHIYREEVEIFSRFRGCFSASEEEKIVGHMLGRTRAELLQEMIPWLMAYLTSDEQNAVMSLWHRVTRNTKFAEWLGEWWKGVTGYCLPMITKVSKPAPPLDVDPLEVVSMYLLSEGTPSQKNTDDREAQKEISFETFGQSGSCIVDEATVGDQDGHRSQVLIQFQNEVDQKKCDETNDRFQGDGKKLPVKKSNELSHPNHPLVMNQEELEATIRRVSRDSNLDCQKKSYVIQNLLMSRWIVTQKTSREDTVTNDKEEIPGLSPSYRDPLKHTFGCKHYKRNCKILAPCCNKLYTCIRCHDDDDEITDHCIDRKTITEMMCMKCLKIQPIGPKCTTSSCNDFSMARFYCSICKLFDDERQIYHCPYCNLCRVGKGLGFEYFHCMKCNACMSRSLFVHVCREKSLEENCPICNEFIFTSCFPVKALPCGHSMHSACFQEYTCSQYICPICSKSLGDMQVFFGMLDALLAEEKIPEEYAGKVQVILCNDCDKRGSAAFHWLYHKCPNCGSFNTRLV